MSANRTKGKRYDTEPKLNLKKVFGTIVAIILIIFVITSLVKLLKSDDKDKTLVAKKYFTAYKDGKWGIIDQDGNLVINTTYDEMLAVPDKNRDVFIYAYDIDEDTLSYKTKAINAKKQELFTGYDQVQAIENFDSKQNIWYEKDVLKVQKNGKYGLINLTGENILKCEYDKISALQGVEGNLLIEKEGKIGLANTSGQVIVEPTYKNILSLKEGHKNEYIIVDENDNKGVISTSGSVIIEPKYKEIKYIDSGENFAVYDGTWKIATSNGTVLLDQGYEEIRNIKGENVIVKKDGKYGVVTTSGEIKLENQYEDLNYAFSIYYIAKKDGKFGIININGESIIPFEYINMYYIEEGTLIVADKTESETVVFDSNLAQKFSGIIAEINKNDGYIKVFDGENYKYYNFKFEEKSNQDIYTKNTLYLSKKDGKYGYVNKEGKVIVDYIYEDATEQNEYGYAAVKLNGLWGCIDKTGKRVLEPSINLDNSIYTFFIADWHLSDTGAYYTK